MCYGLVVGIGGGVVVRHVSNSERLFDGQGASDRKRCSLNRMSPKWTFGGGEWGNTMECVEVGLLRVAFFTADKMGTYRSGVWKQICKGMDVMRSLLVVD